MSVLGNVLSIATTQPNTDSSTYIATTAFVHNVLSTITPGGSIITQPVTDSSTNAATTAFVHNVLGAVITQPVIDNTTNIATTAFVHKVLGSAAGAGTSVPFIDITNTPTTLAGYGITDGVSVTSPALLGLPTAPTAVYGTNTTQLATTAFVELAMQLEPERTLSASTATTNIDLIGTDNASFFAVNIQANTTITFTNIPVMASGSQTFSFALMTKNNATAGLAVAFGNTIKWAGGLIPPRTTAANAIDVWSFTIEAGILYGSLSIINAV